MASALKTLTSWGVVAGGGWGSAGTVSLGPPSADEEADGGAVAAREIGAETKPAWRADSRA